MDWKRLARRAVRTGVRQGITQLRRSGKDTTALTVVDSLLREQSSSPAPAPRPRRSSGKAPSQAPQPSPREDFDRSRSAQRQKPTQRFPKRPDGGYPGDYRGPIRPVYTPDLDGDADPGEIVWAWVPYEEDHTQGKDRPVLVIGTDGRWLLALMLTSKDNVPGGVGDVRADEHGTPYINVGTGDWDSQGRPSEIRLDRVIRIEPTAVRREGAIMPMERFSRIVAAIEVE